MERKKLINELTGALDGEEKVVLQLAGYYSALGWKNLVSAESKGKIEAGLDVLKSDSEKHARIMNDLVAYIQANEGINEF